MNLLFRVLYAAHARGTHHKLALDALPLLTCPEREGWQRVFLKHAEPFMVGAKLPDDEFKDFKNHVLHPRDDFWGGAPGAVKEWYAKTVEALASADWETAARNAGVLSHYVTDPVHPFHTGQTEAENSVHRAFEWSTAKSYPKLMELTANEPAPVVTVPDGADWIEALMRAAAAGSNKHYEKLIAHYDIHRGVVDPPAGLDAVAQKIVGRLIRTASATFATVLDRALIESKASPPEVSLALDTVLATLKIPIKKLLNTMADREDRAEVQRMYDELMATGTVDKTLGEDDRMVAKLYKAEVVEKRAPQKPVATVAATIAPAAIAATPAPSPKAPIAETSAEKLSELQPRPTNVAAFNRAEPKTPTRPRLSLTDNVVDAPSIGPKMAERLSALGIKSVSDLLDCRPEKIAEGLAVDWVRDQTVADWQAQARLVCAIPGLSGAGAQLLVGAGYRDLDAIAAADGDAVAAKVLTFASTSGGRRLLRDGDPPDLARIKRWVDSAREVKAA
ncbi:MAG: DUF4332 domain-containing protein [Proteobacteria bacterium]|nr:DUF4332 domain-containing protein [Pseudomonadota bacterium]